MYVVQHFVDQQGNVQGSMTVEKWNNQMQVIEHTIDANSDSNIKERYPLVVRIVSSQGEGSYRIITKNVGDDLQVYAH